LMLEVLDTQYAQKVPVICLCQICWAHDQYCGPGSLCLVSTVWLPVVLYFSFRCMKLHTQPMKKSNGRLWIVKCALSNKVDIPSNSSMVVDGTLSRHTLDSCTLGLIQPWSKPVLPDGITTTPTLGSCITDHLFDTQQKRNASTHEFTLID
jgi:hypothetical protein